MKTPGVLKHFIIAFVIAVAIYVVFFNFIEGSRTRKGPWRAAFASAGGDAPPFLIINQPKLNISDLRITFPGQSAPRTNAVIVFDQPRQVPFDVPFGQCIFLDLISQPGTVALKLFDHDIQLIGRTLTIDKKEFRWQSDTNIIVGTR